MAATGLGTTAFLLKRDAGSAAAAAERGDWRQTLRSAADARARLADVEAGAVRRAKRDGASWDEVAAATGLSRSAAQRRWGDLVDDVVAAASAAVPVQRTAPVPLPAGQSLADRLPAQRPAPRFVPAACSCGRCMRCAIAAGGAR